MLRYQAAENWVTTSDAAKKELFTSRDNCTYWILNNSKEYHMGFTRKQKAKKLCAKKWSKKHIFLSHFFIFHRKPKCMLKFLPNDFRVKIRKKGLSHSVQKHFPVSGHATLRVVWWCHERDYICPVWVLSKFGPIEVKMCRAIANWFFPSNRIKRYFNWPLRGLPS